MILTVFFNYNSVGLFISRSSEIAHLGSFLREIQQYSSYLEHILRIWTLNFSKCNEVSCKFGIQKCCLQSDIRTGEKEFLYQNLRKSEPKVKVRNRIVFHYSEKAHRRG